MCFEIVNDIIFDCSSAAQSGHLCTQSVSHKQFEHVKQFTKMHRFDVNSYPAAPWSGTLRKSKLSGCCEILPDPPDSCRGKVGRVIFVYRFF